MYKLTPTIYVQEADITIGGNQVIRLADNAFIPFDEANTCYQAYLEWLSEGNQPLPPDEPAAENEQPSA